MVNEKQSREAEMPGTHSDIGRRNLPKSGMGASNIAVNQDTAGQETERLMEAVVEGQNISCLVAGSNTYVSN